MKAATQRLTHGRSENELGLARPYRLRNFLRDNFAENIAADVRAGLTSDPKSLPSKYLYDARGSELFERICDLPEYYQTRTEISRKFNREGYERRIERAGFQVRDWHSDAGNYFCLLDLVRV